MPDPSASSFAISPTIPNIAAGRSMSRPAADPTPRTYAPRSSRQPAASRPPRAINPTDNPPDDQEVTMTTSHKAIAWTHSLDDALKQARTQNRLVLLDFSAAPM
jgi:hypothetical protein